MKTAKLTGTYTVDNCGKKEFWARTIHPKIE